MISLFQTASGAWHYPSIFMVSGWLVTGILMFGNLLVNRNDRLRAHQKEAQSVSEAQIAKTKIATLEEKTRTLTTAEKLYQLMERVDPKFRAAIASGQFTFEERFREFDYGTLKLISRDDLRVKLVPSTNTRADNEGAIIEVMIHIEPEVFTK